MVATTKVKEEREKAGLKLIIQKTKIIASGPITSWQIDGETMEIVRYFCYCSHEIKRCFLLGRKVLTNLDSIKKQRHYFLTKVRLVKALVFSVVMYGHELGYEKAMIKLDSILKSRDITLSINVLIAKAIVFSNSHVIVRVGQ